MIPAEANPFYKLIPLYSSRSEYGYTIGFLIDTKEPVKSVALRAVKIVKGKEMPTDAWWIAEGSKGQGAFSFGGDIKWVNIGGTERCLANHISTLSEPDEYYFKVTIIDYAGRVIVDEIHPKSVNLNYLSIGALHWYVPIEKCVDNRIKLSECLANIK